LEGGANRYNLKDDFPMDVYFTIIKVITDISDVYFIIKVITDISDVYFTIIKVITDISDVYFFISLYIMKCPF